MEQLLSLIPSLFEGNGNLASLVSLLPSGILPTVLNSPYGPAVIDVLNSQTGNRPLEYSDRLLSIFPIPKFAWTGTGVLKVVSMAKTLVGNDIPKPVIELVMTTQYNIYGSFPSSADILPSAIFVAVNAVLMVAHFYVFARGFMRRHYFYLSFGLGWQCIFSALGFGMRIGWSKNILELKLGIASTIFIILSIVLINFMNFLLAHRILTYRHPETGDSSWFGYLMILLYLGFLGVLLMAIVTQITIFSYFLDYTHWRQATSGMQASSVLIAIFSAAAVFIIIAAYVMPRGILPLHTQSRLRLSASNIESYGMFYFPPKHSQIIQYKGDPSAKMESGELAARVINGRDLGTSAMIVIFTTLLLLATAAMRCATIMIGDRYAAKIKPVYSPTWFYIGFGLFETVANVIYLVIRVDLRFYIPDWPRSGNGPGINPVYLDYSGWKNEKLTLVDGTQVAAPPAVYSSGYKSDFQELEHMSELPELPDRKTPPEMLKHASYAPMEKAAYNPLTYGRPISGLTDVIHVPEDPFEPTHSLENQAYPSEKAVYTTNVPETPRNNPMRLATPEDPFGDKTYSEPALGISYGQQPSYGDPIHGPASPQQFPEIPGTPMSSIANGDNPINPSNNTTSEIQGKTSSSIPGNPISTSGYPPSTNYATLTAQATPTSPSLATVLENSEQSSPRDSLVPATATVATATTATGYDVISRPILPMPTPHYSIDSTEFNYYAKPYQESKDDASQRSVG